MTLSLIQSPSTSSHLISVDPGGHVEGTQLLTPTGWKDVSQITQEDTVLQWNQGGSMEFVKPLLISSSHVPYTVTLRNKQGHFNQEVSPNHQMIYTRKGEVYERLVQNITSVPNRNTSNYVNTGRLAVDGDGLSVRERLLIAIQADGYFNSPKKRTGERIGAVPVMFPFAKERKSQRLIELAAEAGLRLDDRKVDNRGRQHWALYVPSSDQDLWPRDKKLSSIADFGSVSTRWCSEFVDEVALWDGHILKENNERITWRCVDIENAEYVQVIATLAGYRTHFSSRADNRSETFSDVYTVQIAKHLNVTSVQSVSVTKNDTPKHVYCIEVHSGYLLTRKDGGVSVTGSARH